MTYCPPERSPRFVDKSSSGSRTVETQEGQTKRTRGRRGRGTVEAIQRTAHERQTAWLETEQPTTTYRLTRELDELYGEHRDEQAGALTDPFLGRTWSGH